MMQHGGEEGQNIPIAIGPAGHTWTRGSETARRETNIAGVQHHSPGPRFFDPASKGCGASLSEEEAA